MLAALQSGRSPSLLGVSPSAEVKAQWLGAFPVLALSTLKSGYKDSVTLDIALFVLAQTESPFHNLMLVTN